MPMGNKFGDAYREERRRIHREAMRPRRERQPDRQRGERRLGQSAKEQTYGFGNGQVGGSENFSPPVHGYMEGYGEVTASFGQGSAQDETLIADGHVGSRSQFDGHRGRRGHDHHDGHGGAPHRGQYNGPGY